MSAILERTVPKTEVYQNGQIFNARLISVEDYDEMIEHGILTSDDKVELLNGIIIELNFYSLIHILNRHYAELISSQSISTSKSFHNPKVEPTKINLFVEYLFEQIRKKDLETKVEIKSNEPILFNYFENLSTFS